MATVPNAFLVRYPHFHIIDAEIMLLELTGSPEDREQTVFDIQAYFNSVQSKFILINLFFYRS